MIYAFPRVKFADSGSINLQFTHVMSEMSEAYKELKVNDIEKFANELMDLYHSVETCMRMLEESGYDIGHIKYLTEVKNHARGYYTDNRNDRQPTNHSCGNDCACRSDATREDDASHQCCSDKK